MDLSNGIRFSITTMAPPYTRLLKPIFARRAAISLFDALTPSPSGLIFQPDTIAAVSRALAGFIHLAAAHKVSPDHILMFATEAMRRADNAGEILAAISNATGGLGVQILEPAVETLFGAVMGSRSGLVGVPKGALFLDLGGGSVQMTWVDTSVAGYETKAASAGSSMPYGAAKLMKILTEQPVDKQRVEVNTLQSGMATVFGVLCKQFPALGAIKAGYGKGDERALIDVYMCGGGFRGYGSMLMHTDDISPYPITSVNNYSVDGVHFKQTKRMEQVNASHDAKIFGMSKRRREQFPAILHVIEAFVQAVPNIGNVTFCGGSNRQGVLMMMMPPEIRESNPLEVLAGLTTEEKPVYDAALEILRGAMPAQFSGAGEPDAPANMLTVLQPGLGYLFLQMLWSRAGYSAEANASYALHNAAQRDSETPGLTHVARAILGYTVAVTTQGKLAPVDKILFDGFEAILHRQGQWASYLARYLATAARVLTNVVPCRPDSVEDMKRMIK